MVEGLARYCKNNEISMYVVSGDAALRKAAGERETLIPLETIEDILAAATAEAGGDLKAIADRVFAAPGFDDQLTEALRADLDFVDFAYYGSLSDVSVLGAELDEIVSVDGYDVAAFDEAKIGIILQANAILAVRLRCMWTRPNCVTRTTTSFRPKSKPRSTHARLKIYVSIDLRTLRFMETELLTRDVLVE